MTSQEICPVGTYCQDGIQHPCPARHYGSSKGLSSSECSGLCKAGYYCPVASISGREHTCDITRSDRYCPEGSARPLATADGFYAVASDKQKDVEDLQALLLEPAANVAPGYVSQEVCPRGSYCLNGKTFALRCCPFVHLCVYMAALSFTFSFSRRLRLALPLLTQHS